MDKETKFSISRSFTIKSLSFLLAISVIATVLGFGVAYNEHRNLMSLWEKYDEALEKIESCEEAVSELSQQVSAQEKLLEEYEDETVRIKETFYSSDGTEKYLFELADGNLIEGVLMKYKYGFTQCVSTQVGCRMGCKFCASTVNGLVRNLTSGEILSQILVVKYR